jgi:hypothetical protein
MHKLAFSAIFSERGTEIEWAWFLPVVRTDQLIGRLFGGFRNPRSCTPPQWGLNSNHFLRAWSDEPILLNQLPNTSPSQQSQPSPACWLLHFPPHKISPRKFPLKPTWIFLTNRDHCFPKSAPSPGEFTSEKAMRTGRPAFHIKARWVTLDLQNGSYFYRLDDKGNLVRTDGRIAACKFVSKNAEVTEFPAACAPEVIVPLAVMAAPKVERMEMAEDWGGLYDFDFEDSFGILESVEDPGGGMIEAES